MRRASFSSCVAAVLVGAVLLAPIAAAQDRTTAERLEALNQETRQQLNGSGIADFVWWLPTEWWRLALSGNETVPEPFLQRTEAAFARYTLVLIAHGNASPDTLTWTDETALRAQVALLDRDGRDYSPIATELVAEDARAARVVGARYADLDDLTAQIKEAEAARLPADQEHEDEIRPP